MATNKVGPFANGKATSPAAKQPKASKPDGNVAAEMKKHRQKHGTSTLAERAKALYPSSK